MIDLDIKDIKVDQLNVDVLNKASRLISLYSKQTDFKQPIVPATAPKGKIPKGTIPCSTSPGKLLGRGLDSELCILADLYEHRPKDTIVSLLPSQLTSGVPRLHAARPAQETA